MMKKQNQYLYAARIVATDGPNHVGLTHYYYDRQILQDVQADLLAQGREIIACQIDWTDYVPKVVQHKLKTSKIPVIDGMIAAINV